jgi:hypothetical protein
MSAKTAPAIHRSYCSFRSATTALFDIHEKRLLNTTRFGGQPRVLPRRQIVAAERRLFQRTGIVEFVGKRVAVVGARGVIAFADRDRVRHHDDARVERIDERRADRLTGIGSRLQRLVAIERRRGSGRYFRGSGKEKSIVQSSVPLYESH